MARVRGCVALDFFALVLLLMFLHLQVSTQKAAAQEAAVQQASEYAPVNRIRLYPATGHENDVQGGYFSGSNTGKDDDYHELIRIEKSGQPQEWLELSFDNKLPYRYVRYSAPSGSHCRIAEIELSSDTRRLRGEGFGSVDDNAPPGAWQKALDGKVNTYAETKVADNQFVGVDLAELASCKRPSMNPRPGQFDRAVTLTLDTRTRGATIKYSLDGSNPEKSGKVYASPITLSALSTVQCVALKSGMATSPVTYGVYQIGAPQLTFNTLHVGNSLTASTHDLPLLASTVGIGIHYKSFLHGGATTKVLWDDATGVKKEEWSKDLDFFSKIDHFTLQPRDFDLSEEADYDLRFLKEVRQNSPTVKPWLYAEWVEFERKRPTDLGREVSLQMTKTFPALTWEESMSAMVLYVEDLRLKLSELDKDHKPPQIIPSAIAMGWMHRYVEEGKMPGIKPGQFHASLFRDGVHPNANGSWLVDLTWLNSFTGRPVQSAVALGTTLTPEQSTIMSKLSWDVVNNYAFSGRYHVGRKKVQPPSIAEQQVSEGVTTVTLHSKTPGAWFRYSLDGTEPDHGRGYIYCGIISLRPGMTLKAVAFKNDMADSPVVTSSR